VQSGENNNSVGNIEQSASSGRRTWSDHKSYSVQINHRG